MQFVVKAHQPGDVLEQSEIIDRAEKRVKAQSSAAIDLCSA